MGSLVVVAHSLDVLTFWMALALFGIPISAEQNPWMVGAYSAGGYLLVLASKAAFVSLMLYLLHRVTEKPAWPLFLVAYGAGIIGASSNMYAIHRISW